MILCTRKFSSCSLKFPQIWLFRKFDPPPTGTLTSESQSADKLVCRAQSFSFHLGADLQIPTDDRRKTHQAEVFLNGQSSSDPFDGLPLKAWAERMGERIMPTYELIKDEQRKSKALAKNMPAPGPSVPTVPHLLPFTRW